MALRTQGLEIPQQAVSLVGNDELTTGGGLELSGDVAASKLELERHRRVVAAQPVPSVAVEAKAHRRLRRDETADLLKRAHIIDSGKTVDCDDAHT